MNLGDFGEPAPVGEPIEFGYFGEVLRANPELGELDYVEFMATAGGVDTTDIRAVALVKDFAGMCIHPEDFDTFWTLARRNRQQVDDIYLVCYKIVAAVTDRPTVRPSDSSAGPSSTPPSSGDSDFSTAMRRYEGRPDLQLAIVRAHDERVSA